MKLIMAILILIVAILLIAMTTIIALNQLFAVGIPHSPVSYMNIIFLMFLIRILVTPNSETKKMQIGN
jgi:hypothetical protein